MRRLNFVIWLGFAISTMARSPASTGAAIIEGRVVDADGNPLARAEVRIWRFPDWPVEFDGSDVLLTDAEGRFVSPDVLIGGASARVVAEAPGMLAGRTSFIRIAKDAAAVKVHDITLKRLRIITGQVLDRRGQPVDGATVFNSGDGHERVEASSKGGGRFILRDVPKGGVFLFAERPGYRFTGVRLPADQAEATLMLTPLDEPVEPMSTLPPLLSPDEEYSLARAVLDPWLERLAQSGTPEQKASAISSLSQFSGREALERLDRLVDVDKPARDRLRFNIICSVIADRDRNHISWPELRTMIEAGDDHYLKALGLIQVADTMDASEQATRLEWTEAAKPHARKEADPAQRVRLLASLAERLFDLGEVARARQVLTEAENDAKPLLLPDYGAQYAYLRLAQAAAAHGDADRAHEWLAKSGIYLQWHGGRVAARLLPDHPRRAVEAWNLVAEAMRKNRGRTGHEYRVAAEFCYRLALVDRSLAEQVAADAGEAILRYREKGAMILALAETQPAEARRLLAALVREEIPQLPVDESWHPGLPMQSAAAIAAWLLPVAEQVGPELCGELFWRSLALRLPRPGRNNRKDQAEDADIELAKLLARYDRGIARVLLEPLAANASALGPTHVQSGTAGRILLAAVHIDPRWAKSFLESVAEASTGLPPRGMTSDDSLRFNLLYTLSLPLPDRWDGRNESDSAAYWAPSPKNKPLPP